MTRAAILRALEDAHNELAHIRAFPHHYASHIARLAARVACVARIRELLEQLSTCQTA
jgi:hypothetical protein